MAIIYLSLSLYLLYVYINIKKVLNYNKLKMWMIGVLIGTVPLFFGLIYNIYQEVSMSRNPDALNGLAQAFIFIRTLFFIIPILIFAGIGLIIDKIKK